MPTGNSSDFVIYNDEFHMGATEVLTQDTNVFNNASAGTILMSSEYSKGAFQKEAMYSNIPNLVSRRDLTSNAAATALIMQQHENANVKLNRKIGPVEQTVDSFRKIDEDPRMMSYILGQQWAKEMMVEQVNTALAAAVTSFANVYDQDENAVINHGALARAMGQMGDGGNKIRAFVMHSKVYYDLMQASISDKITDVAGVTINNGTIASLGRPVIVTDSPSLISTGTGPTGQDEYRTLGLTVNAVGLKESEGRELFSDTVLGDEQVKLRIQGEYAYNLGLKGFTWNIAGGGENPNAAAIATVGNWTKTVADDKNIGGVVLTTI